MNSSLRYLSSRRIKVESNIKNNIGSDIYWKIELLVVFITIHIKWYKLNYQINFVLE